METNETEQAAPRPLETGPSGQDRTTRLKVMLAGLTLLALTVFVYWGSFDGKFIFDDLDSIVGSPLLRPGLPAGEIMTSLITRQRPLTDLSFLINHRIGGLDPWGYHLVNLAIHALAALTLFGLLRRLLVSDSLKDRFGRAATPLAFLVAAIWAVHPLQTEAVTYIVQRSESLCMMLYLLTLYCVVRGYQSPRRKIWFAAAVVVSALGMGAKLVMVTAPLAAILLDRTLLSGSFLGALRKSWRLYVGLAVTSLLPVAMFVLVPAGKTAGLATASFTPASYLVTEMGVFVKYVGLIAWPANLCLDYWWWARSLGEVWWQTIVVAMLAAGALASFFMRPPWRYAGLCGVLFFLILAPTSSIMPVNDACVEHRLYLPLAAVTSAVVLGLYLLASRLAVRFSWAGPRWAMAAVAVLAMAALIPLAMKTVSRNRLYADPEAMWRNVLDQRDNPRAAVSLGAILASERRDDEALKYYQLALEMNPTYAHALCNVGDIYLRRNQLDQAIEKFQAAIRKWPQFAQAWHDMGLAFAQQGKYPQAADAMKEAIKFSPHYFEAHRDLGRVLDAIGESDAAVAEFQEAFRLRNDPMVLVYLARSAARMNNLPQAVEYGMRAAEMSPDLFEAQVELGIALGRQGRSGESVMHLAKAVSLRPDDANAHRYLGLTLVTMGQVNEGIGELRRATDLAPEIAVAHFQLGVAYQQVGDSSQAITAYRNAIAKAPDMAAAHLNLGMMLEEQGRQDEAIESYRNALKYDANLPQAKEALAKALARQGKR